MPDKAALFGLQWPEHIKLNWQKVCCMQGSVSGELEKHTDVSGKDLALPTCRERPTTIIFQTKVSSVRTEEEGRGRTGKVGADEGD